MTPVPPSASGAEPATKQVNPWLALSIVLVGATMVVLDSTIVAVALSPIGKDLRSSGDHIEWIVTAYLLAVCASQPATGWLANRYGRKRSFLLGIVLFTCASIGCALSPSLGWLIAARVVQGLGGGAVGPVAMAMVLEAFPRERHGRAVAVWGMSIVVGPAVGPTAGGALLQVASWHWLFLINAPIGIAVLLIGMRLIPDKGHREDEPFDWYGLALGGSGLTLFVLGISQGTGWGWTGPATMLSICGGLALLGVFVAQSLRTDHPLIELRVFSEPSFRVAMIAYVLLVGSQIARLVYVPKQLQELRGFTAMGAGALLIIPAGMSALSTNIGGRLVDRIGPRRPTLMGAGLVVVALLGFSRLTLGTPTALIIVLLSVQSFGFGLTSAPTLVVGLSDLPPRLVAQASAVRSLMGQVAGALAVAGVGAVVAVSMGDDHSRPHAQHAYNRGFLASTAGALLALALAMRLPRHTGHTAQPIDAAALAES